MRPGRLDRILYVGPPDFLGRLDILRIRTRNMSVDPALDHYALAALVRPSLPPFNSSVTTPMFFTDERMFWRRNRGYVPGSRLDRYARGHQHAICEVCFPP
jgi:SpoVK/Ycf46/Vps4 family AAA+-type ATPase